VFGGELDADALVGLRTEHLERAPLLRRELKGGEDAVALKVMDPDLSPLIREARP
jgi:hypothetical protein